MNQVASRLATLFIAAELCRNLLSTHSASVVNYPISSDIGRLPIQWGMFVYMKLDTTDLLYVHVATSR